MVAHVEIEDDGARDVRHHGAADGIAPAVLFEVGEGTPHRLETEGTASGEHDAVHGGRDVTWIEELDAVHPGRPSGDLERAHRGPIGKDDGAAGERLEIRDVAHANPGEHARTLANSGGA
jgi:hypothetical protein